MLWWIMCIVICLLIISILFGVYNFTIYKIIKDLKSSSNFKGFIILAKEPFFEMDTKRKINANGGFNCIVMTQRFYKEISRSEKVSLAYYLLGHELSHIVFKDYGKKQLSMRKQMKSDDQIIKAKSTAMHILKELRADIFSALKFPYRLSELTKAHVDMEIINYGVDWRKRDTKESYNYGYPSRKERLKYSILCSYLSGNNCLNKIAFEQHVLNPLINRYLNTMTSLNLSQKYEIIEDVKQEFWTDCNNNFL